MGGVSGRVDGLLLANPNANENILNTFSTLRSLCEFEKNVLAMWCRGNVHTFPYREELPAFLSADIPKTRKG